ncbi:MAG: hypothetical protein ACYTXA_11960 [Nostoc sp.]
MSSEEYTIISRTAGSVEIDGIYISSINDLINSLPVDDIRSECIFADLSLGAWFGYMVAQQFCLQLGILPPKNVQPTPEVNVHWSQLPEYADKISEMIDAESSGNRILVTSLELAEWILETIGKMPPQVFVVIAPRFGFGWEAENEMFIEFLVMGLRDTSSRCILAFADIKFPDIPKKWKISWLNEPPSHINEDTQFFHDKLTLVPGIIEPRIAETIIGAEPLNKSRYIQLANGSIFVAPECRRNPEDVSKSDYDELGQKSEPFGWLRSYSQLYGNHQYLDLSFLRQEASQRFTEGAYNIAFKLIQPVLQYSSHPLEKASAMIEAQGMRIALRKFEDAAKFPEPPHELPDALRGALLQCKAWGLVMINQPEKAEPYFQESRYLLRNFQSRYYLYLLNISALNKLRLKQIETALELEKEIEQKLFENTKKDWHLEYVNSINMARLFRKMGEFELAKKYYYKAFSTNEGLRSDSDLVYNNVCFGYLYYEKNLPKVSFLYWFRSALHWAATAVPEALAPRVSRAIIGRSLLPEEELPEEVSKAFISLLYKTATSAKMHLEVLEEDIELAASRSSQITFIRSDNLPVGIIDYAFGYPGWSVLGTKSVFKSKFRGKYYEQLNWLLVKIIEGLCPAFASIDIKTLIVETMFGSEMPATLGELVSTCVRLRVSYLHFGGHRILDLTQKKISALEKKLIVQIGNAPSYVNYLENYLQINFKRYFKPLTLSEQNRKIFLLINGGKTVEDIIESAKNIGFEKDSVLESLRFLEKSRVTVIRTPEDEVVFESGLQT